MVETFKDIATVVGCISACITLLTLIIKPLRQKLIDKIASKAQTQSIVEKIDEMHKKIDTVIEDNKTQQEAIKEIKEKIKSVQKDVLDNEADRLRSELFDCGNRCRRGIRLHPEEFEHIRNVYNKYSLVLKQNGTGTAEMSFITEYYNHQEFPEYHKHQ